jgi:hypothetical protein
MISPYGHDGHRPHKDSRRLQWIRRGQEHNLYVTRHSVIGHGQRSTEDENGRGRGAVVFKQRLRRGAEMMTQRRGEEGFSVVEFLLGVRQGSR